MHINIGDKFIAIKKVWFLDEGSIINVTNVDKDDIVSFTFGEENSSNGYMDINTFNNHFKKIEDMVAKTDIPAITEEYILEILNDSDFEIFTTFDKCTIVSCKLPNGFVVTESSACVNPADYNEEIGTDACIDKITRKVWELEAYRLQQALYEAGGNCCCENCDGCNCECEEEFDECLDTDLDCDDCGDTDCPYRVM